jgi:tetratricopeptide (TPR) repeat protein
MFSFRVDTPGDYELTFQRQDNASGRFDVANVDLLAADAIHQADSRRALAAARTAASGQSEATGAPGTDGSAMPGSATPASGTAALPNAGVSPRTDGAAADLAASGRYDEALSLYADLIDSGRIDLYRVAGDVASAAGLYGAAADYYGKALRYLPPQERYETALQLMEASRVAADPRPVAASITTILEPGVLRHRDDLIELARLCRTLRDSRNEAAVLEALLNRFPPAAANDAVYYRLGQIYETEGVPRDERRAFEYYRDLTRLFPLSTYYEQAEARMRYIERHYLIIR